MATVRVDGMNDVLKKLERLAKWSEKDYNNLVSHQRARG